MKSERPIAIWLLIVAFMVFCMVILGGATRLTHSGLSMVEWRPLMGILPPWGEAAWQDVFAKYQLYPEYLKINKGMTLSEFKQIFYFEYSHRVLGRLIGAAFALPFLFFLFSKRVTKQRLPSLIGLFLIGGFQGLIGWWMVKSGLVEDPDVSHYRLTVHLGVAILIFGALIWVALNIISDDTGEGLTGGTGPTGLANVVVLVVFVQMLLGAMVAGLDAGFYLQHISGHERKLAGRRYLVYDTGLDQYAGKSGNRAIQPSHRCLSRRSACAAAVVAWSKIRPGSGAVGPSCDACLVDYSGSAWCADLDYGGAA